MLFASLIYALINNVIIKHYSLYNDETNFVGIVDNFTIDGDKVTIQVKAKETIQGTYYLKNIGVIENDKRTDDIDNIQKSNIEQLYILIRRKIYKNI